MSTRHLDRVGAISRSRNAAAKHPFLEKEFARAFDFHRRGRLAKVQNICLSILAAEPGYFDAALLLGVALLQRGEFAAAERQIRHAIQINPSNVAAYFNHGFALHALRRFDEAVTAYDNAIRLKPDFVEALNNRGLAFKELRRFNEALASYDRAIALAPDCAESLNNRGVVLRELGFLDRDPALIEAALPNYERAIQFKPNYSEAFDNRGIALRDLNRMDEALLSHERAIALKPDFAEAFNNRGIVLRDLKRLEEALTSFDKAIALKPNFAEPYYGRGCCRLALGDMPSGWADYERRWEKQDFECRRPDLDVPPWSGESLAGRSILIYEEQGFGDIIQFCRYLPLLSERGAAVSFLVRPHIARLLRTLAEDIRLLTTLEHTGPFDFQCALMSLPHRFGTDLSNIPSRCPYLSSEAERARLWHPAVGDSGFKVGICWQGNPWGGGRSFPLRELRVLSQIDGVRLISLQKGLGTEQLADLPRGMVVETLDEELDAGPDSFVDTAALMQHLDLIVTCDTATAHLAGSLGRRVWVALKYVAEWRWMLDRNDSPWYPTMRLFRQMRPGDWSSPFEDMARELAILSLSGPTPHARPGDELAIVADRSGS